MRWVAQTRIRSGFRYHLKIWNRRLIPVCAVASLVPRGQQGLSLRTGALLKPMGCVAAQQELKLQPNGVIGSNRFSAVKIVLESQFRVLCRIPGDVG